MMRYQIVMDIDVSAVEDPAGLSTQVSAALTTAAEGVPGVTGVVVAELTVEA